MLPAAGVRRKCAAFEAALDFMYGLPRWADPSWQDAFPDLAPLLKVAEVLQIEALETQ